MLRRLLALAVVASFVAPAAAFPDFQKQFLAKYADGSDETYTDLAKKAKCFTCHQGKKSKKNLNAYGESLHQYLHKKDRKDVEKIVASLDKVADESSNPDDPEAPTFGELIAEGKLPGGSLEDLKQEPTDSDSDSEKEE